MERVRVPGFAPSVHGLRFANAFPSAPIRRFQFGAFATLTVGDVANGLCGGMTFVAADCFNAGLDAPTDAAAPPDGSALRSAIVERQLDSFDGGRVPLRFYELALPIRPGRETGRARALGRVGIDLHSRTWLMAAREWPRVRKLLDAGRLVPLGLVRAVSWNPLDLTRNHQVLAWGYDLDGGRLTLRIYDPNWPADDEVTLTLDVGDPDGETQPVYSKADGPVLAFFRAPYRFRVPALDWVDDFRRRMAIAHPNVPGEPDAVELIRQMRSRDDPDGYPEYEADDPERAAGWRERYRVEREREDDAAHDVGHG